MKTKLYSSIGSVLNGIPEAPIAVLHCGARPAYWCGTAEIRPETVQ